MLPAASDEQGASIMKSMMCAMDSMTAQELDSDGKIFQKEPSRLHRIAKGSGATIGELEQLLVQYETVTANNADEQNGKDNGRQQGAHQNHAERPKHSGRNASQPASKNAKPNVQTAPARDDGAAWGC